MAVKTITITEEAYRKLARLKREHESFTDVINRALGGPSALELAGLLDSATADKVKSDIRRMRRHIEARMERTRKAMKS